MCNPRYHHDTAFLSACLVVKGRESPLIIRCLRPISLPGDRSRIFPASPLQGRGQSFGFMLLFAIVFALLAVRSLADLNVAYMSYYNDFMEPSYILGKNWSKTTIVAQQSIIQWADWLAAQGPWCTCISSLPSLTKSSFPDVEGSCWKCCSRNDFQAFSCILQRYARLFQLGTIVCLTQCPLTRRTHSAHT